MEPAEAPAELAALQEKVRTLLTARLGSQVQDVTLSSRDAALVIQGRAKSYYAKQIAQQVVMDTVADRHSIINELEIF